MTADTEQRDALIPIFWEVFDPDSDKFGNAQAAADRILAWMQEQDFRRPREVSSVEELDALPVGSMIREADGFFRLRESEGWILVVKQEVEPNLHPSTSVEFPAVVVFEPEKEA